MILYHGSQSRFDWPDLDLIQRDAREHDRAPKVTLGLYVTPDLEFALKCGPVVYAVELADGAVSEDYPYEKMVGDWRRVVKLPNEDRFEFYKTLRTKSVVRGIDWLRIIESDGSCGEAVIINTNAIRDFKEL